MRGLDVPRSTPTTHCRHEKPGWAGDGAVALWQLRRRCAGMLVFRSRASVVLSVVFLLPAGTQVRLVVLASTAVSAPAHWLGNYLPDSSRRPVAFEGEGEPGNPLTVASGRRVYARGHRIVRFSRHRAMYVIDDSDKRREASCIPSIL